MANEEFRIEVDLSGALDAMEGVEDSAQNTGPLMATLASILHEGVLQNYDREEGPDGAWDELAPATQEERVRKGYGKTSPKLVRERMLRNSILPYSGSNSAEVATNRTYAPLQFLGGKPNMPPGPANVPGRNPMWVNDETQREIDAETDDWFEED